MYQISCDGYILHDVRLNKNYRVFNPKCYLEVNGAGKLTFKIAPTHPYYGKINKISSTVTLTQDGEWVFSGRVLNDEKDFQNVKHIEVEGELSFLEDSNQKKAEYHDISVHDYFETIISKHNEQVEEKKRFTLGSVTVTDPNDSLYRFSNYESTFETIKSKLISRLGGYVRIRHYNNIRYIDYVETYENVNNQEINFGKNLLDLKQYVKGEDIATAIIPLGAATYDSETGVETRLTIESVNDGVDYVYDEDAVALYGWIFAAVKWDDVTLPENLKRKAQEELAVRKLLSIRLELNAVDLHLLDVNIERIKLGDNIRVISAPHGVDRYMMVSKMTIDIENPANNSIVLGFTAASLTELTNQDNMQDRVSEIIDDLGLKQEVTNIKNEIRTFQTTLERNNDSILASVSSNYASKSELQQVNEQLTTQIGVYNNHVEMRFTTFQSDVETIEGMITSNQQLLEEYIRFQGALIELGRVGNSFVAKLSNEKLAFLQDNVEIAYISNNKLYITDAEVRNKLTIGNATNGYFDFIPRANGNLSLKWRAN